MTELLGAGFLLTSIEISAKCIYLHVTRRDAPQNESKHFKWTGGYIVDVSFFLFSLGDAHPGFSES